MNYDQVTGILRAVVPALLTYAAGKGWIPGEQVATLGAALVTLLAAAWSVVNNKTGKVIAA